MPRLLFVLPFLLLAGCDSFGSGPFDDTYLSVYDFVAENESGEVVTRGTIGLTLIPSDAGGIPDVWRGRWDLNAAADGGTMSGAVDGEGTLEGEGSGHSDPVVLGFSVPLPGHRASASIGYSLQGSFDVEGETFSGTWETTGGFTGGTLFTGTFSARLTRRATEFIIAG